MSAGSVVSGVVGGRLSFVAALVLEAALRVASARADAPPAPVVRLVYDAAGAGEACPDERALRDFVVARLGRDPFADAAAAEVRASVTRDEAGLAGRVEVRDSAGASLGARTLTAGAGECGDLLAAMSVAISIALDPATTVLAAPSQPQPVEPPPAADPERPPGVGPTPVRPPAPSAPRAPVERAWGWTVALHAVGAIGATPDPALGGAVGVGIHAARWSAVVELGALTQPTQSILRSVPVRASLLTAAAVPCLEVEPFAACAVVRAGVFEVRGAANDSPVTAAWVDAGARATLRARMSSALALVVSLESTVPLAVPAIRIARERAWAAGPVTGSLLCGVELFP